MTYKHTNTLIEEDGLKNVLENELKKNSPVTKILYRNNLLTNWLSNKKTNKN